MINRLPEILAAVLIVISILLLVHQRLVSNDVWFHLRQIRNHETIVAFLVAGAIGLLAGKYLGKAGMKK
jgi:hypothetical protein